MNNEKGVGQYDLEYKNCRCFWGTEPGKYVKIASKYVSEGTALDLGAGEGKNAIFLAQLGLKVRAVEVSEYAIKNFQDILKVQSSEVKKNVEITRQDVLEFETDKKFNVVIAYGLLHCLPKVDDVEVLISKMKRWVTENGFIVIVTFNNGLEIPAVQDYLEPSLVPVGFLEKQFKSWEIIALENDIIEETHPTSKIPHKHSVTRLLAKKTE